MRYYVTLRNIFRATSNCAIQKWRYLKVCRYIHFSFLPLFSHASNLIRQSVIGEIYSCFEWLVFEQVKKKRDFKSVSRRDLDTLRANIIRGSEEYATQFHQQLRRCPCRFFLLAIVVLRPISWQSSEKFRTQRERERERDSVLTTDSFRVAA